MEIINKLIHEPTNPEQVIEIAEKPLKYIPYPNIENYKSIYDLLDPFGIVLILYLSRENYGHWCLLFKYPNSDTIEFFDPYGLVIDDQLNFAPEDFRKTHHEGYPYLLKLLSEYPYKVVYNQYAFQERAPGVSTCGRQCGIRARYSHMCLHQYMEYIANLSQYMQMTPDEIITLLSLNK